MHNDKSGREQKEGKRKGKKLGFGLLKQVAQVENAKTKAQMERRPAFTAQPVIMSISDLQGTIICLHIRYGQVKGSMFVKQNKEENIS